MQNVKYNRLGLARKRLGYDQKLIARLIGYRATDQISRFETGLRPPTLKVALKLAILYKLSVRVLFHSYHELCRKELETESKKLGTSLKSIHDVTSSTDYCTYVELMNSSFMTDSDKEKVQRHIKSLMDTRRERVLGE